jgi:protein-tyrosine phosphatase
VTEITCTPHCRDPYFDYDAMWQAFYQLQDAAGDFPLHMGFEVNHHKLMDLGMDWARVLGCYGTADFLLELSVNASPSRFVEYERTIFELQGMGYNVIIAHPERYVAVQRDVGLARELVDMGCRLQAVRGLHCGWASGCREAPGNRASEAGALHLHRKRRALREALSVSCQGAEEVQRVPRIGRAWLAGCSCNPNLEGKLTANVQHTGVMIVM